ncbi:MAG: Gfo/Idh/MocA family protein [Planctomycetota bacterium]
MAKQVPGDTVRAAIIGWGMGRHHAKLIAEEPRIELVAVCDLDEARRVAAEEAYPGIKTYARMGAMLRRDDIDLAIVVTPHNVHCKHVCKCLEAGKHTVTDKPMCITVKQADQMIAAARKAKRSFTVFQNRRLDGDFLTIRDVIAEGLLGDVFHIECFTGRYGPPRDVWRSYRKTSGGAMYDWGAHFIDWILTLIPAKIANVTGFFHDLVWDQFTNEDQGRALIRFKSGAVGDFTLSHIDMVGKERWRVLGTRGGLTRGPDNTLRVRTLVKGHQAEIAVKCQDSRWPDYYHNLADHLLDGAALLVQPEESRRVIGVLEAAAKSAKSGKPVKVPHE